MKSIPSKSELLKILPDDDILQQCMHCGLCLATCPTYDITKLERSSPRGRIFMIKSVARGQMQLSKIFVEEMNFCLDCQACETICPAGVKYGKMVESARELISHAKYEDFFLIILKRILFRVISSRFALKLISRVLWFYQKSGLQKFLRKFKLLKLISNRLYEIENLAPPISNKFTDKILKEIEAPDNGVKFKTAFHFGCLMNTMFADINQDTIEVLKYFGCQIITPKDQVCCGSLMGHNGELAFALKLARKNIDVFLKYDYEFLISNSAGCGAFMKDYAHLLEDDPEYATKAKIFSSKVKDVTEFIYENNLLNELQLNSLFSNYAYHEPCHLIHAQKVSMQPREIIKFLVKDKFVELNEASWCCGSAGIYNVIRYDDALKQLERKMKNIKKSNADIVLTGNPGCIGQIKYGAKKFNVNVEVLHPITLIKQALKFHKTQNVN